MVKKESKKQAIKKKVESKSIPNKTKKLISKKPGQAIKFSRLGKTDFTPIRIA